MVRPPSNSASPGLPALIRFSSYQLPARLSPRIAHLGEKLCYILFSEPKSMIWCVHVQFRFTYHCRRSRWRYHVRPPCRAVFRSRRCRYARSLGRAVSGSGVLILFVFSILIARGFSGAIFYVPIPACIVVFCLVEAVFISNSAYRLHASVSFPKNACRP